MSLTKKIPSIQLAFFADEDRLKAYNEEVQREYKSEKARNSLTIYNLEKGIITGSNSFANQRLAGNSLAKPAELIKDYMDNQEKYNELYIDLGVILKRNGDSHPNNNYNAKYLYNQLKRKGIIATPEEPVRISSSGLLSIESTSGKNRYGLLHKLTDETEIIQAHEFSDEFDGRRFLRVDERGVPIYLTDEEVEELSKDEISKLRTFLKGGNGLFRTSLFRNIGLSSYWGRCSNYYNLANSGTDSRVIVKT